MSTDPHERTFGPVPSRRLGRSIGLNNVPPKQCTYSCAYCQLGPTRQLRAERCQLEPPEAVAQAAAERLERARRAGEQVDYLTFVADGEPTLDLRLGQTLALLRPLGAPLAVITNGSLVDRPGVRSELLGADWLSLKVDAAEEPLWRRVNAPHPRLRFASIVAGMQQLAAAFEGELTTETMLLADINDSAEQVERTAQLVAQLAPRVAYLAVPTRPPARAWARPATEAAIARAHRLFEAQGLPVELLLGYEGDDFSTTGTIRADLLGIVAVHPMREEAVRRLLERGDATWEVVEQLEREGKLVSVRHGPHTYYMRAGAAGR